MSKNNLEDKIYILVIDIISIMISFFVAFFLRFNGFFQEKESYDIMLVLIVLLYIFIFNIFNSYSELYKRGRFQELKWVIQSNVTLALIISGILFYFKIGSVYSRIFFASFFLINIVLDYFMRQYFKKYVLSFYKKSELSNKVVVVSTSEKILSLIERMKQAKEWKYQIASIAILDADMIGQSVLGIPIIASKENILEIAKRGAVDEVFICLHNGNNHEIEDLILDFQDMGITVNLNISAFGMNLEEKTIGSLYGHNVLTFSTKVFNNGALAIKRMMDILGAMIGIAITIIISIIVAPAILIESPGKLIFSQVRIGKNGRKFKIYKFRSMYPDAEARKKELMSQNEMQGFMFKISKDPRITKVGEFIRRTSIDELPQFFNVLRGDMSLVGTRPPTEDEFLQYEGRHKRRLALKPGITGLWQVSGRSDIDNFEDVVKLDLEYIDNWSLLLDIKLLLKTVFVVIMRVGAK